MKSVCALLFLAALAMGCSEANPPAQKMCDNGSCLGPSSPDKIPAPPEGFKNVTVSACQPGQDRMNYPVQVGISDVKWVSVDLLAYTFNMKVFESSGYVTVTTASFAEGVVDSAEMPYKTDSVGVLANPDAGEVEVRRELVIDSVPPNGRLKITFTLISNSGDCGNWPPHISEEVTLTAPLPSHQD